MMEVFIAGLILIGVLSVGGVMTDETSTSAPESPPVASIADSACGRVYLVCGEAGPHHRDLTVPYASRLPAASTGPEESMDCRDG